MKIKELIELLAKYDGNTEVRGVVISKPIGTGEEWVYVNTVDKKSSAAHKDNPQNN